MYASGNNVSIGKNLSSFQFFAQYWYRVDPLFDESNHPTLGENMKELSLSGAEGEIYGGEWGYYNWCNSHVPDAFFTDPVKLSRLGVDCPDLPYGCSEDENTVYHANPVNGWIKMQWEGDYDAVNDNPTVRFTTYPDGQVTALDHYGNPITTYETLYGCGFPQAGGLRFLGIGGFARVPRTNNGVNSFRYFAGVYIDATRARVMLGDALDAVSDLGCDPTACSESCMRVETYGHCVGTGPTAWCDCIYTGDDGFADDDGSQNGGGCGCRIAGLP